MSAQPALDPISMPNVPAVDPKTGRLEPGMQQYLGLIEVLVAYIIVLEARVTALGG